jgi:glutathione synthase/RimK-type ligase-like ATP-grasp enzyme
MLVSRARPPEDPVVQGEIFTTPLVGYAREDFEPVRHSPCLFQEYVPKAFELRVTVVRDRVFAAEIHSQALAATRHDWRRPELSDVPHRPHELPEAIAGRCVCLVARLGLQFGAIDMIYTPSGEYVFLEINPNGQYGWIEDRTGMRISQAIAEALVEARPAVLIGADG